MYLAYWWLISEAVAALVSRQRSLEMLLLMIAGVLVGRLIVANQAFVPSELLSLALLLPVVVLAYRMTVLPKHALLLCAALATFTIQRLAPFDFGVGPSSFDLWPFLAWFDDGVLVSLQRIDWVALFGTLFSFAAVFWAMKESGASVNFAVVSVVSLALLVEILQLWLPDRTASLTDPALALALCLAFRYLYARTRPRRLFAERVTSPRGRNL
jgi:VanZ family protein